MVNKLYVRDDEIIINYSKNKIELLVNGKEEKIDSEDYDLFNNLYSIIKCERVKLYISSSGSKLLEIYVRDEGCMIIS